MLNKANWLRAENHAEGFAPTEPAALDFYSDLRDVARRLSDSFEPSAAEVVTELADELITRIGAGEFRNPASPSSPNSDLGGAVSPSSELTNPQVRPHQLTYVSSDAAVQAAERLASAALAAYEWFGPTEAQAISGLQNSLLVFAAKRLLIWDSLAITAAKVAVTITVEITEYAIGYIKAWRN